MHKFTGTVKKSAGRGRKLGFPTANIDVPDDAPEGIFFALTTVGGKRYPSLFFIGRAMTFDEDDKRGEAYLLDFEADLYGEEIIVRIVEKYRENIKFDSREQLIRQMQDDRLAAKEYFGI